MAKAGARRRPAGGELISAGAFATLAAIVAGCLGRGSLEVGPCTPEAGAIEQQIFRRACGQQACHGPYRPGAALVLTEPGAASKLVQSPSGTCEGWTLVVPKSPEASLVYLKLAGQPPCGEPMPNEGRLSAEETECVRQWIASLEAAPDGGCEKCGGATCANFRTDSQNCGACGAKCPAGASCSDGRCLCATGATLCDALCVDLRSDSKNCGACQRACPSGAWCSSGSCACASGLSLCGALCVDTSRDSINCGGCGKSCPSGAWCSAAACACPSGMIACGSACADTTSDPTRCGDCATTCAAGKVCYQGTCADSCGALTQCGASCVDTRASELHCGACGSACPAGASCVNGSCQCPSGTAPCGGKCINTATDPSNCGGCAVVCPSGASCTNGSCACPTGTSNCSGVCVSITSDPANCGACGRACTNGQTCQSGTCACPGGGKVCATSCVNTQSDLSNCGSCGNVCSPGQSCTMGACTCGSSSVSYFGAIQPIFDDACVSAGCHRPTGPNAAKANLDLTAGKSYAGLVNAPTDQCSDGRKRVAPGSPSTSYLMDKLLGVDLCGTGTQMPKAGTSLPSSQLTSISNWICNGAPNN